MATSNKQLMQQARQSLDGKWGLAIGTTLLYTIIVGALQAIPGIGFIAGLVISGPMAYGITKFSLLLSRNEEARLEQIFDGFQNFQRNLIAYLIVLGYTILWLLCLIIPGIIAALSYAMTFYIIYDDENINPADAIDKSKVMMDGHKLKLFYLGLRFLLWALLCVLTLGLGFLLLLPYIQITLAKFYDDIKDEVVYEG
jgi:uncharacterized membrane protein